MIDPYRFSVFWLAYSRFCPVRFEPLEVTRTVG